MAKLTRDLFIPFLDTTRGAEPGTYTWCPVDLSTVFNLAFNPQTETFSYICNANDSTEITSYQPSMEQEIAIDSENPLYKFMFPFMREMPVGSKAKVPVMIVYPSPETGKPTEADVWPDAVVSPGAIDSVAGKLTFTLQLNGDKIKGTVAVAEGGKTATFSPAMAA